MNNCLTTQQALVAANRELITRFEKKIQATLARIWGEDEATPSVSQPMSEALELDGLTNQAGAASTAPCATSLDS